MVGGLATICPLYWKKHLNGSIQAQQASQPHIPSAWYMASTADSTMVHTRTHQPGEVLRYMRIRQQEWYSGTGGHKNRRGTQVQENVQPGEVIRYSSTGGHSTGTQLMWVVQGTANGNTVEQDTANGHSSYKITEQLRTHQLEHSMRDSFGHSNGTGNQGTCNGYHCTQLNNFLRDAQV